MKDLTSFNIFCRHERPQRNIPDPITLMVQMHTINEHFLINQVARLNPFHPIISVFVALYPILPLRLSNAQSLVHLFNDLLEHSVALVHETIRYILLIRHITSQCRTLQSNPQASLHHHPLALHVLLPERTFCM